MNKELFEIIKNLKGNVLAVGITDDIILDKINKNDNIKELFTLNKPRLFEKKDKYYKKQSEKVKIKKLKKRFKNKIDYVICDVNGINTGLKKVVNMTYSVVSKEAIYYGEFDEFEVDKLKKRYERFAAKCDKKMYKEKFILKINMKNIKVTHLAWCGIIDILVDIIDAIGSILLS